MEGLNKIVLIENKANDIDLIRKTHGLDQPGSVETAVAALDQWVKSQKHFGKKDFPKPYLEATLMASKGNTEKAKEKIENLFSLRTELPAYFGDFDMKKDFSELDGVLHCGILPKLNDNQARVIVVKITGDRFMSNVVQQFNRIFIMILEYLRLNDKNDGFVLITDMTEMSMMPFIRQLRLEDVRRANRLIIGIYGSRFKGIHVVSTSRFLSIIVWILKQVVPAKLGSRIHAHKSIKCVYDFVDRDLLPQNFGGKESSIEILYERLQHELGSDEFRNFQREMSKAVISDNSSSTVDHDCESKSDSFEDNVD